MLDSEIKIKIKLPPIYMDCEKNVRIHITIGDRGVHVCFV